MAALSSGVMDELSARPGLKPTPLSGRPENGLIAALPTSDRDALLRYCERVHLAAGQILFEPGDRIRYAYFPVGAVVCLVCSEHGLQTLEVGIVGADGMVGTSLTVNLEIADMRALTHASGPALRIEASALRRAVNSSGALRKVSNAYMYALMSQLAQRRACTSQHFLEARLVRCLLMTRDRAHSDTFQLTPQLFACFRQLQSNHIVSTARSLQNRNFIRFDAEGVHIIDGEALEVLACPCYAAERHTLEQLFGDRGSRSA